MALAAHAAGDAANGAKLFAARGCVACHTTDGTPRVGPTLKGIAGSKVTATAGGATAGGATAGGATAGGATAGGATAGGVEKTIVADDAYLASAIKEPHKQVVKGFPDAMVIPGEALKDSEIQDLVTYLKTLK